MGQGDGGLKGVGVEGAAEATVSLGNSGVIKGWNGTGGPGCTGGAASVGREGKTGGEGTFLGDGVALIVNDKGFVGRKEGAAGFRDFSPVADEPNVALIAVFAVV